MKNSYLFSLIIFSNFVYSNECENQFLDTIVRSVQNLQEDLRGNNEEEQLKAIQEIRDIGPSSETINRLIIPLLKSNNPQVRLSAVQVIGGGAGLYPQFIGVLLLHLRKEDSQQILTWIQNRISHIPPNVRWQFYQGEKIARDINRLNRHFKEMKYWFDTILGITTNENVAAAIESARSKDKQDRNTMEKETVKIYQETVVLVTVLKKSLLDIPHKTYKGFMSFLYAYMKYSQRPVYISTEVQMVIQFFYENFDDILSR